MLALYRPSRRHRSNPDPAEESKSLAETRSEKSCDGEELVA
jgi:hypothetical protein